MSMNIEQARFNMIEQQIRPWDVLDKGVLGLLAVVRREDFVPPAYRSLAFVDTEVPLVEGECMLAPRVEARLLQDLQVQRHERVLEIGAGSGFMAALLGHRAQSVISRGGGPALATMAIENLRRSGASNVSVVQADGAHGHAAEGPFDAIMLSGSVSRVPEELLKQLKPGGRLVAIEGDEPVMEAVRYTHGANGFSRLALFDVNATRLLGFPEPARFHF
jgi:protein-L-isoaspartate(D-aspartate) O-methyltransferase